MSIEALQFHDHLTDERRTRLRSAVGHREPRFLRVDFREVDTFDPVLVNDRGDGLRRFYAGSFASRRNHR